MKEGPNLSGGFKEIGPLRGRTSSVRVAFRPVDPLMEERVREMASRIKAASPPDDLHLSFAVRSVDGFYVTSEGSDPIRGVLSLVRVIEYDVTRGVFLVSGDRDPDPWAAFYWFCLRVFPQDGAACVTGGKGGPKLPDNAEARARAMISAMAEWKKGNPLDHGGHTLFRCASLGQMEEHILGRIREVKAGPHDMSQRS
jgi:hypothetical protein